MAFRAVSMAGIPNSLGVSAPGSSRPTRPSPLAANQTAPRGSASSPIGCARSASGYSLYCPTRGSKRTSLSANVEAIQTAPSGVTAMPFGKASTGSPYSRTERGRSGCAAPSRSAATSSTPRAGTGLASIVIAPAPPHHERPHEHEGAGGGQGQAGEESRRDEAPANNVPPRGHRHPLEKLVHGIDGGGRVIDARPPAARARLAEHDEGASGRFHVHGDVARAPSRRELDLVHGTGGGLLRTAIAEGPQSGKGEDERGDARGALRLRHPADPVDGVDERPRARDTIEPEAVLLAYEGESRMRRLASTVPEHPPHTQLGIHVYHVVPVGERRGHALHEEHAGDAVGGAGEIEVRHLAEEVRGAQAEEEVVLRVEEGRLLIRRAVGSRDEDGGGPRLRAHPRGESGGKRAIESRIDVGAPGIVARLPRAGAKSHHEEGGEDTPAHGARLPRGKLAQEENAQPHERFEDPLGKAEGKEGHAGRPHGQGKPGHGVEETEKEVDGEHGPEQRSANPAHERAESDGHPRAPGKERGLPKCRPVHAVLPPDIGPYEVPVREGHDVAAAGLGVVRGGRQQIRRDEEAGGHVANHQRGQPPAEGAPFYPEGEDPEKHRVVDAELRVKAEHPERGGYRPCGVPSTEALAARRLEREPEEHGQPGARAQIGDVAELDEGALGE